MSAVPEFVSDQAVVDFRQVYKIYGADDTEVRALDGVDLRIERGEFVAIMGRRARASRPP